MVGDAGHTMRNAGLLMAQRGFHVLGVTLFAVLVPRLMGPALFGRYALLISVSLWFALLNAPGAVSMLTRSIPRFVAANDGDGLRRLATSLVVLRALTGSFAAVGYFLASTLVLGEPDRVAAALVAAGVLCCTVGTLSFALFLGLNQAARWGLGDLLHRWLALAFVPIGFAAAGLRGACLGFLGVELTVAACGLWWARRYLRWRDVDLSRRHLGPHLRTGMHFAAGAVLMVFTQRSGETLVRLSTGRYEDVAFFGLAYAIYLTIAQAMWQFAVAFAPFLVTLLERGRRDDVALWLERLLKYMVVGAVLALAGMIFVGRDAVPLLLGAKFHAVAENAVPPMLALLTLSVGMTGRLLALTLDRPGATATGAAIELAAFWLLGVPLAMWAGSLGACWAVVPASALHASYITWRMRRELPFSLVHAGRAVALSLVFAPLALLRGAWPANALLWTAGAVLYGVLLLKSRVITTDEVVGLWGLLRSARPTDSPVG